MSPHTDEAGRESARIRVDRDRCVGGGMCALVAPDVFTQDDDGLNKIIEGQEYSDGPAVREAMRACPVQAINVVGL
ncbi:ferredoxin [Streptomyces violaceus]|uniref:Ferredoxin n=1 Tax=Streptomyces violaceus TaxID=1936 RepID=A0ABY9U2N2_STRVL|nr:ferredoxin [Streptomyces janthinus]WND16715.1 ferredoxin [Streptomyces janthinus]GGS43491.1 ferredoxin [Streptomyces janthinus]